MKKEESKFNGDDEKIRKEVGEMSQIRKVFDGKTFLREFPDKQKHEKKNLCQ